MSISGKFFLVPILLLGMGLSGDALGETPNKKPSSLTWASTRIAATPGETFDTLLYIKLEPGWHTYWTNPGGAGAPPRFLYNTTSAATVGEAQWPQHEVIPEDQWAVNGYKDEVGIIVPVTITDTATVGEEVLIELKASWLVCEEICVPQKAALELRVPVSNFSQKNSEMETEVARWKERVPGASRQGSASKSNRKIWFGFAGAAAALAIFQLKRYFKRN